MPFKPDTGASRRGVHYYLAFRECPRLFYYKNVLGLRAAEKKGALVKGKALHSLQEEYLGGQPDELLKEDLLAYFNSELGTFFDEAEAQEALESVWRGFVSWRDAYGARDSAVLSVEGASLMCETEFSGSLDPEGEFPITGRVDRLYDLRTMCDPGVGLHLLDTKTSSRTGAQKICENALLGDQLAIYSMLVEQALGERPLVSVDAVAFRKGPADVLRSEPCLIPTVTIEDSRLSLLGTAMDVRDRQAATHPDTPQDALRLMWPRHTMKCELWGCPYSEVCRQLPRRGEALVGYTWVDPEAPDGDADDSDGSS